MSLSEEFDPGGKVHDASWLPTRLRRPHSNPGTQWLFGGWRARLGPVAGGSLGANLDRRGLGLLPANTQSPAKTAC